MQIIFFFVKFFFQKRVRWGGGVPFYFAIIYTNCIVQYFVFRPGCCYNMSCFDPYYTEHRCKEQCIRTCPDSCYNCCQKYYSHIVMGTCRWAGQMRVGGMVVGSGMRVEGLECNVRFCTLELYFTKFSTTTTKKNRIQNGHM